MHYTLHGGAMRQKLSIFGMLAIAAGFALTLVLSSFNNANAASMPVNYTTVPFTQAEIDANWTVDRALPSGGFGSVSYEGRDDVLEMNIDGENRSELGGFYYTEGLKRQIPSVDGVKADLFVESSWETHDVRAGIWGVAYNASDSITAYPILEYTNSDSFSGWRVWSSEGTGSWIELEATTNIDAWNQLEIVLNNETGNFDVYLNGVMVGVSEGLGSVKLDEVILNSYNYGPEGTDYSVHWSNFAYGTVVPTQVEGLTIFQNGEEIGCDATVSERTITVDWEDSTASNLDHYIYQADDGEGSIDFTTNVNNSERTGDIRDEDGTYMYRVAAVDTEGNQGEFSEWCNIELDRIFDEKSECKDGGWAAYGFRNQGQCIRYINTGHDSRD